MSFVIGDEVLVKKMKKYGKIINQRERVDYPGILEYNIQINQYHLVWVLAEQLEHLYNFGMEFEQSLRDLLIDINLLHNKNNLHIVRDLYDQKFDLLKGM